MIPDFSSRDIDTVSKRAAHRCSNPDCDKLTTGPNDDPSKSTTIGEAAHIFGARLGTGRYRAEMSDQERATISNAIWLCRNCHALIDKDARRFSAQTLLLWKENHESKVSKEVGIQSDLIRLRIANQEIKEFENLPLFSMQLIRDRPDYWEYMLTADLLDFFLAKPLRKAGDIERGILVKAISLLPADDFINWIVNKTNELLDVMSALEKLFKEIDRAWGEPGEPGDLAQIVHNCELYGKCAERLVEIAEEIAFTKLPAGFEGVGRCFVAAALHPLRKLPGVSQFLRSTLADPNVSGIHHFNLIIELPDGWEREVESQLAIGMAAVEERGYW